MICVTIGRGRHKSLLAEWEEAAEAGAELVELRIDCLRSVPNLRRILAKRFTPCVFTVRRGVDGGLWRGDEEKRITLIREAIAAGVDYVDLEFDIAEQVPRYGKTRRIISDHNFKAIPGDFEERLRGMEEQQADVLKFAVIARSLEESSSLLQLVRNAGVPTIGIAMGEVGTFTRVLGAKFGAPFTYAGFNPDRQFAPGMLRFSQLRKDYAYDQIDPETEIYAVIGDPIGHSLSPAIHNASYRHLGMNRVMIPLLVPTGRIRESLAALEWLNIRGLAVTIPHKEAIVPLLARKDGAIERTGSCNTVVVQPDGAWVGYNTDYRAAMESMEQALGGKNDAGDSPLHSKQVLILGAGGVARSIAFGAARRGAGVTLCNRTEDRATKLAADVGCRTIDWSMRAGALVDVLVNCTPVGMHPNVDDSPIPPAGFRAGMLAFDTIYHPENTMFLKLARERDCSTVTGVDMFVRQAAFQFKFHTGLDAPEDLMRAVVKRKLGPLGD